MPHVQLLSGAARGQVKEKMVIGLPLCPPSGVVLFNTAKNGFHPLTLQSVQLRSTHSLEFIISRILCYSDFFLSFFPGNSRPKKKRIISFQHAQE